MVKHCPGLVVLGATLMSLGCQPQFNTRPSQIRETRVLGMQAEPAEAAPNTPVDFSALVVDPSGPVATPGIDWAYCTQAKPSNEINDVTPSCLAASGPELVEFGWGPTASRSIPTNACEQFGPDIPSPADAGVQEGGVQGRPADPDASGGFFQPVRMWLAASPVALSSLGQVRVRCGLPSASGAQFQEFIARYRKNENPWISQLLFSLGEQQQSLVSVEEEGEPPQVPRRSALKLTVSWPPCPPGPDCGDGVCDPGENACPETGCSYGQVDCPVDCALPQGCQGSERYAYFDPQQSSLSIRRESMRVSWFATAGDFHEDHTGRREEETETFSENTWTSPDAPGPVWLWVVLRDSRGGTSWSTYQLTVE